MARRKRARLRKNQQGAEYVCLCGNDSTQLLLVIQFNGQGFRFRNYVPLCDDCLALERQDSRFELELIPVATGSVALRLNGTCDAVLRWLSENGRGTGMEIAKGLAISYKSVWGATTRLEAAGRVTVVGTVRMKNGKDVKIWALAVMED